MLIVVNIFFILFIISCMVCLILYLPRMHAWFTSFEPQVRLKETKKNKIAVIVPARNESKVIGELFSSIQKQTYDKAYFDVHVIVKEETDPTIAICQEENAYVHIVKNQTCKGDAIDGCLKDILHQNANQYDAYIIIDADCMLDGDFLTQINIAMASGCQIIQAKKLVKNYLSTNKKANSIHSSANGLIWTMIDDMGNRFKSDHQITNMTIGTGILFRSELIQKWQGWPYRQTLTEDIELMYDSVVNHYSTFYYSYAIMYVEESPSLKVTNKRRTRWLQGVIDSKRIYNEAMQGLPHTKENRRNKYYTTALSIVFWYIGIITFYLLSQLFLSFGLFLFRSPIWHKTMLYAMIAFGLLYFSFFVLTAVCMIVERKNIHLSLWRKLILLLYHPIFYMGYIPIIFKALVSNKSKGWEVIERVDFTSNQEEEHYDHI